ncbi:olfactory receptor 2D2-like [Arvicanthis niloticus]|uniref:olfactory receptor 2D2-like n=1 Tax=Arvicanthis niloticus TaxID=61156 RepID=UPI001486B912|nr:olfactory receptor 2D2-like [Arvicanthis niloticus]
MCQVTHRIMNSLTASNMWMIPRQNQSWVSEFILVGFSSDPTTNSILFIVFLLIYLSSVLGNGLIIMLVCLDTQLHTPMYFFLCTLSLLDMSYVTTTMPQMLVHLLAHSQTISFAGCWLQMYVFGALGITECTFFVVMAYDRYVAICYPLSYTVILNWSLCIRLAAGTWICGFLSSFLNTFFTMSLPYCGPNRVNHFLCEGPSVRSLACMDTHLLEMVDLVLSVVLVLVPISLIVASYIRIAKAILKIKSTQGRCKAFSTCASHLTVVTLFYLPATYIYMKPNSSYSTEQDKQISLFYTAFTPLLNPVVYSLRNKDIKRAFLKVIVYGRWTSGPRW